MTEDTHYITPTVVYRAGGGVLEAAVVDHDENGRALFLFASEEQAAEYRLNTGTYPPEEGFVNVPLGLEALKDILALHECTHVVLPMSLVGDEGPDFIPADGFIELLEELPPV